MPEFPDTDHVGRLHGGGYMLIGGSNDRISKSGDSGITELTSRENYLSSGEFRMLTSSSKY